MKHADNDTERAAFAELTDRQQRRCLASGARPSRLLATLRAMGVPTRRTSALPPHDRAKLRTLVRRRAITG